MSLQIWFVVVFAVLGFIISFSGGLFVGNRITYILFVSSLATLAFCGLGLGVYAILEKKVPEFLDFLRQLPGVLKSEEEVSYQENAEGMSLEGQGQEGEGLSSFAEGFEDMKPTAQQKSGKFGDHIIVDKIAIKNEPKLMAQAIRTMLAKDEENQ